MLREAGTIKSVVSQAADAIEQYGHMKDDVGSTKVGMCIQGAVIYVVTGQEPYDAPRAYSQMPEYIAAIAAISNTIGTTGSSWSDIGEVCNWNNRPERTKDEVVKLLREVAA